MTAAQQRWWVLTFNLPAQPAYARVKIWRRLQDIGAAALKSACYLLPANEETLEDFEWILREVRAADGDGVIFDASVVEGIAHEDVVRLFDADREQQYRELIESISGFNAQLTRKRSRPGAGEIGANLARFQARLSAIEAIDFFQANGREQAHALMRELESHAGQPASSAERSAVKAVETAELKGRIWVTRANVHVDRMASAWLIRRWIDPQAEFKFVTDRHYRPEAGEVRFDMYEAEFTHEADRCTFEVLAERLGGKDAALSAIGEIVHDLDLKDRKFGREEAIGIQQLLAGIIASQPRDPERLERSAALFDDLYRSFARES